MVGVDRLLVPLYVPFRKRISFLFDGRLVSVHTGTRADVSAFRTP
jgi:hypothetical protein